MSALPEHIDYAVLSSDPSDETDDCIHTSDDGPHAHLRRARKEDQIG